MVLLGTSFCSVGQEEASAIKNIFNEELSNGHAYTMLDHLANRIGGRLSGSPQAAVAVEWGKSTMESMSIDRVWLQEVMVPHWVRGEKEQASITVGSKKQVLRICALGNSIGTGPKGIAAAVIEVKSFLELEKLGKEKIAGNIVFFNRPMDPKEIYTGTAYGGAVDQRGRGVVEAARFGALGVVVRSVTLAMDDHPHTGSVQYSNTVAKIPACAISTMGASVLSQAILGNPKAKFFFRQTCEMLPDVKSHNIVGEIKGSTFPDEIILVGGHLDSWDLGTGAHDDGAGVVQSMEVLRLFKALGMRPRRTIRAVLFMNEENGTRGAMKYAELSAQNKEHHLAAMESDEGGFTPRDFSVEGDGFDRIRSWIPLLAPYGIQGIVHEHTGTDLGPLKKLGVTLVGYRSDSQRYFDYHHAETDTFDKVNKRELELGAANMAALIWLISEHGL
ncbi:MAG: peptidase [Verrucomicrobiales bacterium]|nr:peptidase [Verrucomicrobiales bacterium]